MYGRQFSSDWAFNPMAYSSLSNDEVDWAGLAQQWIKMKEMTTAVLTPPPPPVLSEVDKTENKGEEDMDLEDKQTDSTNASGPPTGDPSTWGNWQNWSQWGYWPAGSSAPTGKDDYGYTSAVQPASGTATIDYNHGADESSHQPVFWTDQSSGAPDATVPSKDNGAPSRTFEKNSRYSWRRETKERGREKSRGRETRVPIEPIQEDLTETLDAAKRKQLPAWIREGLEKMEREKQRKVDKEKMETERREYLQMKREAEEAALANMDEAEAAKFLARSKFDSDGSEGEDEVQEPVEEKVKPTAAFSVKQRKSRFTGEQSSVPEPAPAVVREKSPSPIIEPTKSREELLEEVMLKVRRTLTEILLDITSEEIQSISREVYQKARSKAPAKRLRKTQALSSIAGKSGLGLGIYGSDDEDDDSDSDAEPKNLKAIDSDSELNDIIRRKKAMFAKTAEEIEEQLREEMEREQEYERVMKSEGADEDEEHEDEEDGSRDGESSGDDQVERSTKPHHQIDTSKTGHIRADTSPVKRKRTSSSVESVHSVSNSDKSDGRHKKSRKHKKRRSSSSDRTKKSRHKDEELSESERKKKGRKHHESVELESDDDEESQYKKKKSRQDSKRHKKHSKESKKKQRGRSQSGDRSSQLHSRSRDRGGSRHRSRSREHVRRRSRSHESERRRKSRSVDSGHHRRRNSDKRGRSRSRESDYRRIRSKSRDRRRSRSRESNRHRRSRSRDRKRRSSSSSERGKKYSRRR